jgi:hypothetical protein
MRVEEFENTSRKQLRQKANECFAKLDTAGSLDRPGILGEAQFWLQEIDRRYESRRSLRDLILEIVVIVLIGLELYFGITEGNKQAVILGQMNTSTAATAQTMKVLQKAQQDSLDEQKKSLTSLTQMNDKLQGSLQQTGDMAVAVRKQLAILQEEQNSRLAEQAKKPKLELDAGATPLNTLVTIPLKSREESETKVTFDLYLRNLGDAAARNGILRVIVNAKDLTLECNSQYQRLFEEPDSTFHVILVPFQVIRSNGNMPLSITANFPKGQQPFSLLFNVDADEISTATPLGGINYRPIKPSN